MEGKLCPACGQIKQVDDFYIYFSIKRNNYRIGNYCRQCANDKSKKRAKDHYNNNREKKLQYVRKYRENEENREKIKLLSAKFKARYREELKDCYVRDRLNADNDIPASLSNQMPGIVEAKRLQIKIKRKLKLLKNGTE